jgi:hypothetical protein
MVENASLKNVVGLRPGDDIPAKVAAKVPNEVVIKYLRSLVKMAEAGELQGIAYVGIIHDGSSIRNALGNGVMNTYIGALECLKQRFIRLSEEDDIDIEEIDPDARS